MKRKTAFLTLFLLVCFSLTFSQTRTGILTGRVVDEQGELLQGIAVNIASSALIEGTLSKITNERARYRFTNLPPGVYSLKVEIEGFAPYEQTDIRVRLGLTVTVNVQLKIGKLTEEVEVVAESPMVDLESNKLSVNFEKELLTKLPSSRNISAITNLAPGVVNGIAALGGGARENYYSMDGTYLSDPGTGSHMIFWNYDIIEEAQVQVTGHDAQYGNASAAVVNVITKSGGDKFHGMANFYFRNKSMRSENHEGTGLDASTSAIKSEWEGSLNLGGPILKEKIWFFISGDYSPTISETVGFPEDQEQKRRFAFSKLTVQASQKHKFYLTYNHSYNYVNYYPASQFRTPEATMNSKQNTHTFNLQWNYIINPNALLEVRGAYVYKSTAYTSNGSGPAYYEFTTGNWTNACGFHNEQNPKRYQFQASLSYWLQGVGGDHDIKLGFEFEKADSIYDGHMHYAEKGGPTYIYTFNGAPYMSVVYDPNDIRTSDIFRALSFYAQDTWKIGSRLSLNIGARLNQVKSIVPEQNNVPSDIEQYNFTNIEPRVGFAYDLSSRSRQMVIKAHYGRYYMHSQTRGMLNTNYWSSYTYFLFGGEPILISVFSPQEAQVDHNLKRPYSESITVGFETSITKNLAFKINGIYKQYKDFLGIIDLNRTPDWYEPVSVHNPITNSALTVYNLKSGAPQNLTYYTNPEEAERTYKAIQFILEHRLANNFRLMVSYTLSRAKGTVHQGVFSSQGMMTYGLWNDPNNFVNTRGLLDLDKTHQIKFSGIYYAPLGFTIGLNYLGQSGYPYTRSFQVPLNQGLVGFNAEKLGEQRTPFQHIIDVRVEKSFPFGEVQTRIFFDAFNLLNSNTAIGIGSLYGSPTYGETTAILSPRIFRIGVGFEF